MSKLTTQATDPDAPAPNPEHLIDKRRASLGVYAVVSGPTLFAPSGLT